jgi:hypothetical protein
MPTQLLLQLILEQSQCTLTAATSKLVRRQLQQCMHAVHMTDINRQKSLQLLCTAAAAAAAEHAGAPAIAPEKALTISGS